MKKIGLLVVMAVCALMAQAADYPYLVFSNTAGTATALSVTNMTLTVSGNTLTVTNADGTQTFALTELAAMQFSQDGSVTDLVNVIDADRQVEVYTISGVSMGAFGSLTQAANMLHAGAYVIRQGSNTQTFVVK